MWVEIGAPEGILRYIIEKGSIAIDGISLTVALLTDKSFSAMFPPSHLPEIFPLAWR